MKKTIKIAALALLFSVAAFSCKKNVSDAELTTQSTTVVAAYPGTSVEVKEGVAHLSGTFASQEEKDAAIAALKNVKGVKDVVPYLTRRAQENTSVAGQTGRELSLIKKELERRRKEK